MALCLSKKYLIGFLITLGCTSVIQGEPIDIRAELGETCEISYCTTPNSVCGPEYICVCQSGFIEYSNKCLKSAEKIGDPCEADEQCTVSLGDLSTCYYQGTCTCKANAVPSLNKTKCLVVQHQLGDPCEESIQCQTGAPGTLSECNAETKICSCRKEAIAVPGDNKCYLKANRTGDVCEINEQCQANIGELSLCVNSTRTCDCKPNAVVNSERTKCLAKLKVGDPCEITGQCPTSSTYGICSASGVCQCRLDSSYRYVASSGLDKCLQLVDSIGSSCSEPQQCQQGQIGPLSDCRVGKSGSKVCNCTESAVYTYIPSKYACYVKARFIGDECKSNDQCIAGLGYSQCLSGKCVCFYNAIPSPDNSKCISINNKL